MAYEGFQVIAPALVADADLSSYQYCFVYLSTNNTVGVATSTVALPIGVLQNKPSAAGDAAEVCIFGITKVVAAETIAVSNMIRNSSLGRAAIYNSTVDIASYGVGQVISGAAATQYATIFIDTAAACYTCTA